MIFIDDAASTVPIYDALSSELIKPNDTPPDFVNCVNDDKITKEGLNPKCSCSLLLFTVQNPHEGISD